MIPKGATWVRMPRFIGDSVMIHQAVEPLRAAGHALVAWGPAHVLELFEGSPAFAAVCADAPKKPGAGELGRLLREHEAAAVVNLPRSQRALAAGFLGGVGRRVGWGDGIGWLFATTHLPFKRMEGHQIQRYGALLSKAFPGLPAAPPVPFRPRPESEAEAARMLAEAGLKDGYVAFALGGMSWNKRLGAEVWIGLGKLLEGRAILLLGGPGEDQDMAETILKALPAAVDFTGRAPLSVAAACLSKARALVGNDSSLSHLGAACGIPVVVAYGPTNPTFTSPVGDRVAVVRDGSLPCIQCERFDCRTEGRPCLLKLDPTLLLEALALG